MRIILPPATLADEGRELVAGPSPGSIDQAYRSPLANQDWAVRDLKQAGTTHDSGALMIDANRDILWEVP